MTEEREIVIVDSAILDWLKSKSITGRFILDPIPEDIAGKIVYGELPLKLAAMAYDVIVLDMPDLEPWQDPKKMTPKEMDEAGAQLVHYTIEQAQIGDLKILGDNVYGFLDDGASDKGKGWWWLGTTESRVINIHGYDQGSVGDFPVGQLYVDEKTAAIIIAE